MSEDFIKEVDEDIKEKRIKLWKKLIPYVIGSSFDSYFFYIRVCFLEKLHKKQ